jgi:beta-lactamase class A
LKPCVCVVLLLAAAFAQTAPTPERSLPEKQKVMWQKLEASIHDVDVHLDGVVGLAIEDITTGNHIFVRPDEVFAQASSIKIAVLADLYLQAQQGKLKLTDLYTVQSSDLVPDSDIMAGLTPGITRITLRDLATMMVAVSDNSATNVLIDRVGMENVNAMLESLGLAHTRLRRKMMDLAAAQEGRENISSPREMMLLLGAIYRGKAVEQGIVLRFLQSPEHKQRLMDSARPAPRPADRQQAGRTGSRPQRFGHRFRRGPSLHHLRDDFVLGQ